MKNFGNSLRSSLIPVTMPLAVIVGLPIWLFTGSRRKAINFCIALWADMTCALIGLRLQISGEEHLRSPRPAVFILNHQSNADGFLVAKLIRRDIAFLGKKELSKQRVRGPIMQFAGVVLVDRQSKSAAGRAIQPLIDTIQNDGRSVAIFPEGTRSHSTTPRQFKKGALLIAMRAGVPIVPIVLHNSIDAQPKGETAFRPTTVKVEVLPAIDTSGWEVKSLDSQLDAVRQRYLDALGQ